MFLRLVCGRDSVLVRLTTDVIRSAQGLVITGKEALLNLSCMIMGKYLPCPKEELAQLFKNYFVSSSQIILGCPNFKLTKRKEFKF
jgi:hypothetical protein